MRTYHVERGPQGYAVVLFAVPWWAVAISWAADWLDGALGHVLCGFGGRLFTRVLFLDLDRSRELYRLTVPAEVAVALEPFFQESDDESDSPS